MVGSVEQLPELAPGDPGRAVRPASDGLQGLALRELHFGGLEGRRAEHVGEDGQPPLQILLQDVQRGDAVFAADPNRHVRGQEFELFVNLIAGHAGRPARAHDGAGQGGEPDLLGRLIDGTRPDHGRHGHQRQLGIRQQIDDDPVLQDDALDLRYRERHRVELHDAGIAERAGLPRMPRLGGDLGTAGEDGEQRPSRDELHEEVPPVGAAGSRHGLVSPPSGLTSVATTRLFFQSHPGSLEKSW